MYTQCFSHNIAKKIQIRKEITIFNFKKGPFLKLYPIIYLQIISVHVY